MWIVKVALQRPYTFIMLAALIVFLGLFAILTVMSAAKVIFVSAVYHQINGDPVKHFNQQLADNLFVEK